MAGYISAATAAATMRPHRRLLTEELWAYLQLLSPSSTPTSTPTITQAAHWSQRCHLSLIALEFTSCSSPSPSSPTVRIQAAHGDHLPWSCRLAL